MNDQAIRETLREEFKVAIEVHEEDFLLKFLQHHLADDATAFKHYLFGHGRCRLLDA